MNALGKWIRQKRQEKNFTLEDMLNLLNQYYHKQVKRSTLSAWENEEVNAPIHDNEFVEALSMIFGVSVADVLRGAGFDLGDPYPGLDDAQRLLLAAFDSGDLDRIVRVAIAEIDKRSGQRYQRLDSDESDASDTRAARR